MRFTNLKAALSIRLINRQNVNLVKGPLLHLEDRFKERRWMPGLSLERHQTKE